MLAILEDNFQYMLLFLEDAFQKTQHLVGGGRTVALGAPGRTTATAF